MMRLSAKIPFHKPYTFDQHPLAQFSCSSYTLLPLSLNNLHSITAAITLHPPSYILHLSWNSHGTPSPRPPRTTYRMCLAAPRCDHAPRCHRKDCMGEICNKIMVQFCYRICAWATMLAHLIFFSRMLWNTNCR